MVPPHILLITCSCTERHDRSPQSPGVTGEGTQALEAQLTLSPIGMDHIEGARNGCNRNPPLSMQQRGITIAAVSGTFNMIHPNWGQRQLGFQGLRTLACNARALGTSVVTLCTGTRDKQDMWRDHPENSSASTWHDLLISMEMALSIAEEANITLAIEPEIANVVSSALRARQLLDVFASPRLKIILDPANLLYSDRKSVV